MRWLQKLLGIPDVDDLATAVLKVIEHRQKPQVKLQDLTSKLQKARSVSKGKAYNAATITKRIEELALDGWGHTEIARALNLEGLRSVRGNKFTAQSVFTIAKRNNIRVTSEGKRGGHLRQLYASRS